MDNVLLTTIASAIAIAFAIFIEWLRKPCLRFRICPPVDNAYRNAPARNARFLYLTVENAQLPWCAKWTTRSAATAAWGSISFHRPEDGHNIFGRSMSIRWSDSMEPPQVAVMAGGVVHPEFLRAIRRRDIRAGESERFDVAARFDGDQECYGWSDDNYFSTPPWRNPQWMLGEGLFVVRVEIKASGQTFVQCFRLSNQGPVDAFRLVDSAPDEDEKTRDRR